jgi:sulfite exporter TauE/SafE
VPSAQLFVAAGLTGARIGPLVLAFFSGRIVSYSLWVGAASAAGATLGDSLLDGLSSPAGIAGQVVMIALLVVLLKVDWRKLLARRLPAPGAPSRTPS